MRVSDVVNTLDGVLTLGHGMAAERRMGVEEPRGATGASAGVCSEIAPNVMYCTLWTRA